ncbi:MAG: metal-sulfur cluster assembly factor, partial [Thermoproteota archaeon]
MKNVEERVLAALKKVLDPELGVNVVDLGLLRGIEISEGP